MTTPSRWLPVLLLSIAGSVSAANVQVRTVPLLTPGMVPLAGAGLAATQAPLFGGTSLSVPGLSGLSLASPSLTGLAEVPVLAPSAVPTGPSFAPAPTASEAAAPQARIAGRTASSGGLSVLAGRLVEVKGAAESDPSGVQEGAALDALYAGAPSPVMSAIDAGSFQVNDEGISLLGRAAEYYRKIRRLVDKYAGRIDLAESLDVMADSYGDVWAKVKAMEVLGAGSGQTNTHLEQTLTWVDGVTTIHGRKTAVNTHRVFFHHAANPESEIAEGIRRVDRYLKETLLQFAHGGQAEAELGRFQDVLLVFDTRGYAEIKAFLRGREAELQKAGVTRFRFSFLDEMTKMPATDEEMRADLNAMTKKYRGRELEKIIEGVTYGRYVGLLLELATVDHFMSRDWEILQSGRELFDAEGMYITELDVVARSPEGKVALVEAKSARVPLPFHEVLQDKVTAKLAAYAKNRALLESSIGARIDEVVFSFDVGNNRALASYLQEREGELSAKYGFPVRFVFLKMEEAGGEKHGGQKRGSRRR
ncbi:MAG: hypothetical protein HY924_16525 [Elusimicrobia bacterium]|nr:hypothetical protein [Elusimicrobiota bacterium]